MVSEIHKIDLRSFIFQNFKNPHGKNLDLWVIIQFVQKNFSQGITDFTEANFQIWSRDNIFRLCSLGVMICLYPVKFYEIQFDTTL